MNRKTIQKAAFILALSIPLNLAGGCSNKNTKTEEENDFKIETIMNFSSEDLTKFLIEMSKITPVYNLDEIFLNDEEIASLIAISKNNQECDNEILDKEDIANSIITNSLDENGLITITDDISSAEKKEIDALTKECLKRAITNMIDKNEISLEDACVMSSIKINIGKCEEGTSLNYFDHSKTLKIDYQNLKRIYNDYNENFRKNLIKESFTEFIQLGLCYARLDTCDCRLAKGQSNTYIGEKIGLNNLINSAIYSSDNSNLGNVNKIIFDYLSSSYNHSTSLLLLLAVFQENRNIEDLYKIVFNSDLGALFQYFNLTTKEEIEKFSKIARTLETLTTKNDIENEFYAQTKSTNFASFRDYVGYGYKADIFKTAVTDLMISVAKDNVLSKEEAMFLYKYVKKIILNNTDLNNDYNSFEPNFAKTIIAIENIFFDFLSKFYKLSLEEMNALYDDTWLYQSFRLQDGNDTTDIKFSKLIEKYPLLQFIETNYLANSIYIESFDENELKR